MQETNLYTISIPPMIKALKALDTILDKAAAHAESKKTPRLSFEDSLINDRIVFDQFPFKRQIQIASDNAKGAVGRLTGREVPVYEDTENSIAELKERLRKTIELLEKVPATDVIGKENIQVTLPYFPGMYMSGLDYVIEYLLPNFFFHVSAAYQILRKNGVDIGKSDFLGGLPLKTIDA